MFGRYELLQLLGRGGMGEVYRAFDTERQREVALKLLPEDFVTDAQFTARFRRESLLAAQLNEPHVIPIHDFGEIDGRLFIDMRLVEGEDLGSVLQRTGPLAPRIAADIVRQVSSALDAAHARGLVHRDVKPSNIMLTGLATQYPFAYLVDFGIARSADQLTALTTTTSTTVGTIAYMAPERINSQPFDHRADVYALACVLYEALTATMPFTGDVIAIMYSHMTKPPPRAAARVPGIPRELDHVIARGMAKDPEQRYHRASELAFAAIANAPSLPPETRPNLAKSAPPPPHTPPPHTPPPMGPPAYYGPPPTGTQRTPPPERPPQQPPSNPPNGPPGYSGWNPPPQGRPGRNRRKTIAVAAAVVTAAALGIGIPLLAGGGSNATGGGTGSPHTSVPISDTASGSTSSAAFAKGGTLRYDVGAVTVTSWDPQRSYIATDIANEQRLFVRTLVQFGAGTGAAAFRLHPDLATGTGTATDGARTWTFTLKSGVKWEDGSAVTCDDVRYGISRTFAQTVITGGPAYALQYLDIPSGAYDGPYQATGQTLFDQAVVCSGSTITFHLKTSVPDFNDALTLPAFAPYKKAKDQGAQSNYAVFSDGPYKLAAPWSSGQGGTFVRNDQYDPATDDTSIRRALPDTIVFRESTDGDVDIYTRLLADSGNDQFTVTPRTAPPSVLARAAAQGGSRFTASSAPFVYYVAPNFARLTNLAVRQALAIATDRTAFIGASGGASTGTPAYGIVPPTLGTSGGYKSFRAFGVPDAGDPAAAKAVLQKAGITLPYAIRLVYSNGPSTTPQAQALATRWKQAGFAVTLLSRDDKYTFLSSPKNSAAWEVTVTAWIPDWPSASTIIAPIFDSSINLSSVSNGADVGRYSSAATNALIQRALTTTDETARNAQWAALDQQLAKEVAYIPLSNSKSPRLHGSKVTHYQESPATNGFPDLGQIGVTS